MALVKLSWVVSTLLISPMVFSEPVWLDQKQLANLPIQGPAWQNVLAWANQPISTPDVADQDDPDNVRLLAAALVGTRLADERYITRVRQGISRVQGTEHRARVLAVSREVVSYVISAGLVGLSGPEESRFRSWLTKIQHARFQQFTLREAHELRPNNWGTHAGATRIAIAIYLNDQDDLARAAFVFRGWLGERDAWQGFEYGNESWQAEWFRNYAVNPRGSTLKGYSVDGVLPDDQRRGGGFQWPPKKENYVYEALQGAVTQALLLDSQGFGVWDWGDRALLRAFTWLNNQADFPAEGDDTWLPYVINEVYGTEFPISGRTTPGKGIGFTDWLYPN